MRKVLLIFGLLMAVGQLAAEEWRLVWSDEFDGTGRPDEATWNFERGFVRNHEAQWYQEENAWR